MSSIIDRLNELINIPTKDKKLSIIKVIILFYLMLMMQFAGVLMPSQLIRELQSNRFAQHLIGLITIFVMINLLADVSFKNNIGYAIICYALFLMTAKLDLMWSIIVLGGGLVYYITDDRASSQEEEKKLDLSLPEWIKKEFFDNNNKIRPFAFGTFIVLAFCGLNIYNSREIREYNDKYDPVRFILGPSNR